MAKSDFFNNTVYFKLDDFDIFSYFKRLAYAD